MKQLWNLLCHLAERLHRGRALLYLHDYDDFIRRARGRASAMHVNAGRPPRAGAEQVDAEWPAPLLRQSPAIRSYDPADRIRAFPDCWRSSQRL